MAIRMSLIMVQSFHQVMKADGRHGDSPVTSETTEPGEAKQSLGVPHHSESQSVSSPVTQAPSGATHF